MSRARSANGRQQIAKTSCKLEYKQYKKKAWKTTKELDRHRTTRFLKNIGMIWEVAQQLTVNREGWHRRVAQCVFDMGRTKV